MESLSEIFKNSYAGLDKAKINKQFQSYSASLGNRRAYLKNKLDLLHKNYLKNYKGAVLRLKDKIKKEEDPRNLSSYIGEGSTSFVYSLKSGEKNTAAILYGLDGKRIQTDEKLGMLRKISANILAAGIRRVPRILAYSFEDGAIILELIKGKSLIKNKIGASNIYTDNELSELIKTVAQIHSRDLCIDYYPDNLIYSKRDGFWVIDTCLQKNKKVPLWQDVMALRFMLVGKETRPQKLKDRRIESFEIGLRIIRIAKNKFPKIFKAFKLVKDNLFRIGDPGVYAEFNPVGKIDNEYLTKVKNQIL